MANTELLDQIDAAIAKKNLLNHPFYQDWQAGKLSKEALQLYAAQYYRHVEAFPKHLRVLAARTEGPIRAIVEENLAEEENPAASHPKLWRDFASALGVCEDDITCCPALPGTQNVVQTFREICGDRTVPEAVAALYAYEAQVPEIATTKIDGLKKFYGITNPKRWPTSKSTKKPTKPTAPPGATGWKKTPPKITPKFWPPPTKPWTPSGAPSTPFTKPSRNPSPTKRRLASFQSF